MQHLRSLDGLRGVAVLAVVLYHFSPDVMPGGFLGVDLFFVLSGFLITSLLVREWDGSHTVSLRSFWVRRARRLVPALLLVLAVVGIYSLLLDDQVDGHRFAIDGLASLGYVANWHFIGSGQAYIDQFLDTAVSPLRHMWSLAIEEQFYLVWPLVVLGLAKAMRTGSNDGDRARGRFRGALVAVCVIVGIASFARMLQLYSPDADINRVYYGTDSRAFIILIGALLAALTWGAPTLAKRWRAPLIVAGLAAAVGLVVAVLSLDAESSWLYEGGYGLVAVGMAVVLIAAAQPGRNPIARVLEWRPLVGLGLISYGVYLWHWPISLWIDEDSTGLDGVALFALRSVVTLAVSIASYKLLEMPIRTGRWRITKGRPVLVVATAVVSVAALLLVPALAYPSTRELPTGEAPKAAEVRTAQSAYEAAARCDGGAPVPPIATSRPLLVQFQGNSLAGEVRDCLNGILGPAGVEFETVNPPDWNLCKYVDEFEKQARETKPDAAIFFAFIAVEDTCGDWREPLDELVDTWLDIGTHVYLVPSPWFIYGTSAADEMGWAPGEELRHYLDLAAEHPGKIDLLDAGKFIRTDDGEYVWRMPCLPDGEPGCAPDGTVGVRYIDGLHFCTDPEFSGHGCITDDHMAGQRRAAASLAVDLIPSLQELAQRKGLDAD